MGGDAATVVQSQRVRPEFTAFGQTVWSLDDQTRFAAHLPCLSMAEAEVVIIQMSNSAQRWGIADGGVPVKGGWGPMSRVAISSGSSGRYRLRPARQPCRSLPTRMMVRSIPASPH